MPLFSNDRSKHKIKQCQESILFLHEEKRNTTCKQKCYVNIFSVTVVVWSKILLHGWSWKKNLRKATTVLTDKNESKN